MTPQNVIRLSTPITVTSKQVSHHIRATPGPSSPMMPTDDNQAGCGEGADESEDRFSKI